MTEPGTLHDSPARCARMTNERWPRPCPREVVEEIDGRWYCKQHAAGMKRRASNEAKRNSKKASADAANAAVVARIKAVNEALGITAQAEISDRSFKGGAWIVYSEVALVPLDDLERLARGE